ncbi:unnamed protein product [Protopolystoma xenopodis]|uniref:Uncharacterized protein n=1 Tax=Protopolystoma xenopodis TaxID=117903 RepID=A0A448XK95_9PLAT|nr:unnamed protein product [Protopolystoma xenopodis]
MICDRPAGDSTANLRRPLILYQRVTVRSGISRKSTCHHDGVYPSPDHLTTELVWPGSRNTRLRAFLDSLTRGSLFIAMSPRVCSRVQPSVTFIGGCFSLKLYVASRQLNTCSILPRFFTLKCVSSFSCPSMSLSRHFHFILTNPPIFRQIQLVVESAFIACDYHQLPSASTPPAESDSSAAAGGSAHFFFPLATRLALAEGIILQITGLDKALLGREVKSAVSEVHDLASRNSLPAAFATAGKIILCLSCSRRH